MSCYHPTHGYWSREVGPNGKRLIVFDKEAGYADRPVSVPCGGCVGCRLERAQGWAVRLMHEKQMHVHSWFVTLTYADDKLPAGGSLVKEDFQKFMKRLRAARPGQVVRFFMCGEYGEKLKRPHYHAVLFGVDFPDRVVWNRKHYGVLYRSPELERLWPHGFTSIGAVTYESAAYVARYVLKKVRGAAAKEHYLTVDVDTGELSELVPEYVTMSLKPGIGAKWIDRFASDVYPSDFVVMNGKEVKTPRYYDKRILEVNPDLKRSIKHARISRANSPEARSESSPVRLEVKEEVKTARIGLTKREL